MAHVDYVVHGLSLATITGRWLDKTPFVQICTARALACLETVEQRPCVTRETETWLSDSSVSYTGVMTTEADDQSSLHCVVVSTGAMSDHIGHRDVSHGGGCSKTSACMGQFGWATMTGNMLHVATLRCKEGGATLVSTGSHETQAAWSTIRAKAWLTPGHLLATTWITVSSAIIQI